jgi:hypothetical protein
MNLWRKLFGGTNTPSQPKQAHTASTPATVPKSTIEQPHVHVDDFDSLVSKLGEDANIRAEATEALGKLADPRAFEPLVRCLRDPNAEVRARACIALHKLDDKRAVEPLIEALKDEHEYVGKHAAEALGSLGDKRAVAPLEKAAANRDRFLVSVSANMALQELQNAAKNPRPALTTVQETLQFDELTVADNKTTLVWTRDANIPQRSMPYQEAVSFIKDLNIKQYAGCSDWRLPSIEELKRLVGYAKSKPGMPPHEVLNGMGFKNVQRDSYWSCTDKPKDHPIAAEDGVWALTMYNGLPGGTSKRFDEHVWPVRGK